MFVPVVVSPQEQVPGLLIAVLQRIEQLPEYLFFAGHDLCLQIDIDLCQEVLNVPDQKQKTLLDQQGQPERLFRIQAIFLLVFSNQ